MAKRSLYWVRNDHRLDDNAALTAYCNESDEGLILYAPSASWRRAQKERRLFFEASLNEFLSGLRKKNQTVVVCTESIEVVLEKQIIDYKIDHIYFSKEVTTEEVKSEQYVHQIAQCHNIRVTSFYQDTLLDREDLPFAVENLPKVFTEFRKKVEKNLLIRSPLNEPQRWPQSAGKSTIDPHLKTPQPYSFKIPAAPGERGGQHRLKAYFHESEAASTYKETRNGMIDWNHSTKFSLWLAQGSLSARRIYQELQEYEDRVVKNDSTYWIFFELLWRDYFKFYAEQQGSHLFTAPGALNPQSLPEKQDLFQKWCNGTTGDNFIDANMRELLYTGWMSNRGRQNVASYLAKIQKLPWQWGAKWFEEKLLDYDAANNWGNWSYFSGVGNDPRDRVFNTQTQAKHYDPEGLYQKKWLSYKE